MGKIHHSAVTALLLGLSIFTPSARADAQAPQGCIGNYGINGNECCYTTIFNAIAAANSGDTIFLRGPTLTSTTFVGTIDKDLTIVPGEAAAPGFSGCEVESTTASIVLQANGASQDPYGGMMRITNGADVHIRNITIQNATAQYGGLIAVLDGSTLRLTGVTLRDGHATQLGGNIYVEGSPGILNRSNLHLYTDTKIYNGVSDLDGGGIALHYGYLTLFLSDVGLSDTQFNTAGRNGGGIHLSNSLLQTQTGDAIQWNVAGQDGGGLYAENSSFTVAGSEVWDNSAGVNGGGIYTTQSDARLWATQVWRNSAVSGGGGGLYSLDDDSLELELSNIQNNQSVTHGGGVSVLGATTLDNLTTHYYSNSTQGDGGGLFLGANARLNLDDATVHQNTATGLGGGIACDQCDGVDIVNDSTLSNNTAEYGGALHVSANSDPTVQVLNSAFTNNGHTTNTQEGGAIHMLSGQLLARNALFEQNAAFNRGGAIAFNAQSSSLTHAIEMTQTLFNNNSVNDGAQGTSGGGALHSYYVDSVWMDQTVFSNNASGRHGGGAYLNNSTDVFITDSNFVDNEAGSNGQGGGLAMVNTDYRLQHSQWTGNSASTGGGLTLTASSHGVMHGISVLNNSASSNGGGLYVNSGTASLINSRVNGNASTFSGGGLYALHTNFQVDAQVGLGDRDQCNPSALSADAFCSEFIGNMGSTGGAIHASGSNGSMNSIQQTAFTGNIATFSGSVLYQTGSSSHTLELSNLLIHHNGSAEDENPVIRQQNGNILNMNHLTLVDNLGAPLDLNDVSNITSLHNSIVHGNSQPPHVSVVVNFTQGCNNSQAASATGQSTGSNLGAPQFISDARSDYALDAASPGIDACVDGAATDLDGKIRPGNNTLYDQGAFEMDGVGTEDIIYQHGFSS